MSEGQIEVARQQSASWPCASAAARPPSTTPGVYRRRRPEATALYEVVRDNLETLLAAIDDGALAVRIPKHARQELLAYLDCGLLCRGFARLKCRGCAETRLVAFSCKGRGFCPSCMGRRMCATAANLIERVLPPETPLRQWVLTFPFPWRPRLAQEREACPRGMVSCSGGLPRSSWIQYRRSMPVERRERAPWARRPAPSLRCRGHGPRPGSALIRHAPQSTSAHDRSGRRLLRARE